MTSILKFKNLSQTSFQTKEKHHFHLVDNSQLPIITAFAFMLFVLNIVFYSTFVYRKNKILIKYKTFLQALPYFDRLDHVSNHIFVYLIYYAR